MAFISAETGTLTFAIISLVFNILGSLTCIGWLIVSTVAIFFYANEIRSPYSDSIDEEVAENFFISFSMLSLGICIMILFFSLVSLLFSSFLMNGILKKKPEHIKVYFIFGVVKTILALLVATFLALAVSEMDVLIHVTGVFLGFGVYSLILYMIRYTYKQLEQTNVQYGHKPLVEKC